MRSVEQLLADRPFFAGLDDRAIALIAGCAGNVHYRPGEYLFRQNDPADRFYVLRRGRVELSISSPNQGPLVLQTFEDEDVVGWTWLVPPYRWEADGRAGEPTDTIAFDGECLRHKCEDDPVLGYELLKRAAGAMNTQLFGALARLLDLYGVHQPAPSI